ELHALAELEDQRLIVRLRPGLGQPGLDAELVVQGDDRLEDVVIDLPVDLAAGQVRIHRGRLDIEADPESPALLRSLSPRGGHARGERSECTHLEQPATRHSRNHPGLRWVGAPSEGSPLPLLVPSRPDYSRRRSTIPAGGTADALSLAQGQS